MKIKIKMKVRRLFKIKQILLGVIFGGCFIKQLYSYSGGGYKLIAGSSYGYQQLGMENILTCMLKLAVIVSIILLFYVERNYVKKIAKKGYYIVIGVLILGITFWMIITSVEHGFLNLLYESTPPYVYLTALALCIGADPELYHSFLEYAKKIGVISLILSVISYFLFLSKHPGSLLGNSSVLVFFIQAFWLLYIVSLSENGRFRMRWLVTIVTCGFLALMFNSRSWIIQSVIWALIYSFYTDRKKGIIRVLKILFVIIVGTFIVYKIVKIYSPETLIYFFRKIGSDTRSSQYIDIFNQTSLFDYIIGRGYDFQYNMAGVGAYSYIDNAYLLMFVRYGFSIGLMYPLIFLIPLWKSVKNRMIENRNAVVLAMWLCALGGLSVYCVTIVDMKSIALAALAGRCLWENRNFAYGRNMMD